MINNRLTFLTCVVTASACFLTLWLALKVLGRASEELASDFETLTERNRKR